MAAWLIYLAIITLAIIAFIPALHYASKALNNPLPSFVARVIASWLSLVACAIYGTIATAALRVAGYGGLGQWTTARAFKWTMWCTTGVWFDVHDPEHSLDRRPALLLGNHQTELDVLLLGAVFPQYCSVSAKSSLRWVPFLGWFMTMSKTIFIERTSRERSHLALAGAAKTMLSERQKVWMFPEGTRSYYDRPDLLPFKKGAFYLAIQAQVPIVPVVAANYSNILDMRRRVFNAGVIPVMVLKAVETKGMTTDDVPALLERVRNDMVAELKRLDVQAKADGVALKNADAKNVHGKPITTGLDLGLS